MTLLGNGHWLQTLGLHDYNTRIVVIATVLLGLAAGAIGTFTLLRRRALVGDALSHATVPGIGLAFLAAPLLGWSPRWLALLLAGAMLSGLAGAATVLLIRRHTRLKEDAALGIVLSVYFGAGLALLGLVQQSPAGHAAGLESFILGKTASMTYGDAVWIFAALVPTLCFVVLLFKELTLLCFDEAFAEVCGLRTRWLDAALLLLVTMVTVVGLQAVGAILIIALMVIPAGAARFWTQRVWAMTITAALLGATSCLAGTLISALAADWPSGPTIVLVAAAIFFLSLLLGTSQGLLPRALRGRRARQHATAAVTLAGTTAPAGVEGRG